MGENPKKQLAVTDMAQIRSVETMMCLAHLKIVFVSNQQADNIRKYYVFKVE
jgi:hypothetical protein